MVGGYMLFVIHWKGKPLLAMLLTILECQEVHMIDTYMLYYTLNRYIHIRMVRPLS